MAGPVRFGGNLRNNFGDDAFGHRGVFGEIGDHHFDGDMGFIYFPAIVVGDHGHRRISNFGFAGAFGFAQVRHADDVVTEFVIRDGLGAGTEGRTLHVDVCAAIVNARLQSAS